MAAITGFSGEPRDHYARLYDNFMRETQPERDSLKVMRDAVRQGREQGAGPDRGAGGGMREMAQDLIRRRRAFEDQLGGILTRDQMEAYRHWREARRKELEGRRPGGGERPPRD